MRRLHEPREIPLQKAATAFLAGYEGIASDGTRKVYRGTLNALAAEFGSGTGIAEIAASTERFQAWFRRRYGEAKPATYVRHLSTFQSAFGWWRLQRWVDIDPTVGLTRPKVSVDTTRALTREQIDSLWRHPHAKVREKTLWRLLYESAARASEVLSLDIEDLELGRKQAAVVGKGGDKRWIYWQTGAAMLLPRIIAGRERGPLFLTHTRPTLAVATLDLCPLTGRARLSYRRAAQIFTGMTGWTFHQLRHSRLTHEAEQGTGEPLLKALSGHRDPRSLARYVNPSSEAVARHVAETDPARRRPGR